jgi:phage-related protein
MNPDPLEIAREQMKADIIEFGSFLLVVIQDFVTSPWVYYSTIAAVACVLLFLTGLIISAVSRALVPPRAANRQINSLHSRLNPSCSADYAGQIMMMAGSMPFILIFHTIPLGIVTDIIIPALEWIAERLRDLSRFLNRVLFHLWERCIFILTLVQVYCEWFWDVAIYPVIQIIADWFVLIWTFIGAVIRAVGRVIGIVIDVVVNIISSVILMVIGLVDGIVKIALHGIAMSLVLVGDAIIAAIRYLARY